MTGSHDRRGFLRGLAHLPLVGGSVCLVGQPVGAAVRVTDALLDSYDSFLFFERRLLRIERGSPYADREFVTVNNPGGAFHWDREKLQPSARAALVLAATGCPLA